MDKYFVIIESSFSKLFQSSAEAFPATTKRQHATDTIKIVKLDWTPFLGVKTLMIKSLAQNEGHEWHPFIVFKGVKYHTSKNSNNIITLATEGREYFLEPLSFNKNDILLRCQCGDFRWRFSYFDKLDGTLFGSPPKKYEAKYRPGSANPMKLPGMCKHLMKLGVVLEESGILIQ